MENYRILKKFEEFWIVLEYKNCNNGVFSNDSEARQKFSQIIEQSNEGDR